jgi:opacity protein-like surface antigen
MQSGIEGRRRIGVRLIDRPGGLAWLALSMLCLLPGLAQARSDEFGADPDPFDRPGFYVGVGGTYQYNLFQGDIEDVIQDALDDAIPGASASVDLKDSQGLNALVGYRVASWFAVELQYEWVDRYAIKGSLEAPFAASGTIYDIEGQTLTANTKWIIPFWRIQPYFLLGGGLAVADVSRGNLADALVALGGDIDAGTHTNAAARVGLGLDLYLTEHILLNAQASSVLTTLKKPDLEDVDDLNYMSFAAGLQYRF